jgi:hypothetical protein
MKLKKIQNVLVINLKILKLASTVNLVLAFSLGIGTEWFALFFKD